MSSNINFYVFRHRVWRQSGPINGLSQLHSADEIPIEFRVSKSHAMLHYTSTRDDPVYSSLTKFPITSRTVLVPKRVDLLQDNGVRLRSILSDLGINDEEQYAVSLVISHKAAAGFPGTPESSIVVVLMQMTVKVVNIDFDTLYELLEIDEAGEYTMVVEDDDDDQSAVVDRITMESMEVDGFWSIATTKSSIEGLEKVTLAEGLGRLGDQRVVCTEEFEAGLEVIRMRCSHACHGDC